MDERCIEAITQLSAVPRFGPARLSALFDDLIDTGMALEDLLECAVPILLEKLHFDRDQADQFIEAAPRARRMTEQLHIDHLSVVTCMDDGWPTRFGRYFPVLWCRGSSWSANHHSSRPDPSVSEDRGMQRPEASN